MVRILFTPTIPHCSMATLIGLSIRVKLLRALPSRFKVRPKKLIQCWEMLFSLFVNANTISTDIIWSNLAKPAIVPLSNIRKKYKMSRKWLSLSCTTDDYTYLHVLHKRCQNGKYTFNPCTGGYNTPFIGWGLKMHFKLSDMSVTLCVWGL